MSTTPIVRVRRTLDSLQKLTAPWLSTLLRTAPTLAKYLIFLVVLLNIRAWPLAWHFRIFRPVFKRRFELLSVRFWTALKTKAEKEKADARWLESITPVGEQPFSMVVPYKTWVGIDDSDFNGHLSNSSYAKTLDAARFKTALEMFTTFFRAGGWMPLAATHYHFIQEIPMLSSYEVRTSIGAWDQKWFYLISKFVRPKPSGAGRGERQSPPKIVASPQTEPSTESITSLRMPGADAISTIATPFPNITPTATSASENTELALKAVSAGLVSSEEPDGATVHTIVVSQLCFKVGRITVPPAIVLASNGFSVPPEEGLTPYSLSNPPPHWEKVKKLASKPVGGSMRQLRNFMKGEWKDVPEEERWWKEALGGAVEVQRRANLTAIEGLRRGMDGVRSIV
ncbi:hypothetical protein K443DRAFT_684765 [Laccaria amethystina LaAM-08-1]|uniref:Thioesterase/thiol ester dehydrase-isomerase n=1 Tax=Laccaria amethystina LaAM-08-1 TaxID=1095629 RepID=A0A0C9X666_9AGAR|nr:hypothetical protein K443DRAFT_684765 [Laccaria amethystina LaAM-08-1]